MKDINEILMQTAKAGSEDQLKALLNDPKYNALAVSRTYGQTALMVSAFAGHNHCVEILLPVSDPLAQDKYGWTALMGAAMYGHEACIKFLLPVSDPLARAENGATASSLAKIMGNKSLSYLIDAYVLAQSEQTAISVAARDGSPRGRAAPRM